MKRRVFLAGIVGTLIGVPISVRLLVGKRDQNSSHLFSEKLKKYREFMNMPVVPGSEGPEPDFTLRPPLGAESRYLLFAPSYLPNDLSQATGHEPDAFFAREGILYFDKTNGGQVVITGGDTVSAVYSPTGTEEKAKREITLLLKDGKLRAARPQGDDPSVSRDRQMLHLLALTLPRNLEGKKLATGTRWKDSLGRVKPYAGVPSAYEIAGFAEIDGRKTVNVSFSGKIGGTTSLSGLNEAKPEKNETSSFSYRGNAWFDPETGLLVRQEVDLESTSSGITSYKNRDGDAIMTVKSKLLIQLYDA